MVDVSAKPVSRRRAVAAGEVRMKPQTLAAIAEQRIAKGDVLEVARIAGIMGAKRTAELIPMCHPIGLDSVQIEFQLDNDANRVLIRATTGVNGRTGVEMEALTAVAVAGLTLYDMCKSVDRGMEIGPIQLEQKSGGKSGDYCRKANDGND